MSTTANEQGTVQAPPIVAQQERLPNPIPGIRPPAELIVEGNIGDNWKLFKTEMDKLLHHHQSRGSSKKVCCRLVSSYHWG